MDAKSKANFINSVAGGNELVCPACGARNKPDGKFCVACGSSLIASTTIDHIPESSTAEAGPAKITKQKMRYEEPNSVFAQGLPEWSLEPPQVVVRRR